MDHGGAKPAQDNLLLDFLRMQGLLIQHKKHQSNMKFNCLTQSQRRQFHKNRLLSEGSGAAVVLRWNPITGLHCNVNTGVRPRDIFKSLCKVSFSCLAYSVLKIWTRLMTLWIALCNTMILFVDTLLKKRSSKPGCG